jgi:hypothetical protein
MTNKELAEKENYLHSIVIDIYYNGENTKSKEILEDVFVYYNKIFTEYVNLANTDDEALKRSLFIQWYSISEPNYLTGIPELDTETEIRLCEILENKIKNNLLDSELKWMLNYYAIWDYIYERFEKFIEINKFIKNRNEEHLPKINKKEMENRGQMGEYWNSLSIS